MSNFSGYSLSSGSSQVNGNHDTNDSKDLSRTFSEDTHSRGEAGNKMEDAPQNAVIKNIKSDILNGFPQRKNDEGGFKVSTKYFGNCRIGYDLASKSLHNFLYFPTANLLSSYNTQVFGKFSLKWK